MEVLWNKLSEFAAPGEETQEVDGQRTQLYGHNSKGYYNTPNGEIDKIYDMMDGLIPQQQLPGFGPMGLKYVTKAVDGGANAYVNYKNANKSINENPTEPSAPDTLEHEVKYKSNPYGGFTKSVFTITRPKEEK